MTDCAICLDLADKKNPSSCPSCAIVCCGPCIETHLLASDTTDPVCPGCKAAWTQTFLYAILKPAFRTGPYQKLREKVLFDREKARLPEVQEDARRHKAALARKETIGGELALATNALKNLPEVLALKKAEVKYRRTGDYHRLTGESVRLAEEYAKALETQRLPVHLRARKDAILGTRNIMECSPAETAEIHRIDTAWYGSLEYADAHERANAFYVEKERVLRERGARLGAWRRDADASIEVAKAPYERVVLDLTRERYEMLDALAFWGAPPRGGAGAAGAAASPKVVFTMKCVKSDCEGFLSAEYKCGLCDLEVCAECHLPTASDHACDPATVATIKHIRKEARSCPTCASLISKIDGCDQMYCTQCHTAFSWNTGRVETGVIHNPHYFQYMRATGQAVPRRHNPGFACDAVAGILTTLLNLRIDYGVLGCPPSVALVDTITESYRRVIHIREVELRAYRHEQVTYLEQEWRRKLRVKRILNAIDDAEWKTALQRAEKSHYKVTAWVHLLEMYTTVSLETFARIKNDSPVDDVRSIYAEFNAATDYTKEQAKAIAKVYGCVLPLGLRPPKA